MFITNAQVRGIARGLDETKPLSGLNPSLDLAKGRVVVASERQIVPTLGPLMFCNTACDGNPAGVVNKAARHGCLPISNLYTSIRWYFAFDCDADHENCDLGLIGEGGPNDGREDFMA